MDDFTSAPERDEVPTDPDTGDPLVPLAFAGKNWVLQFFGSDCTECGNTTPSSMYCDSCGSAAHTVPLLTAREVHG